MIFTALSSEELSLLDNIQSMNKLKHTVISNEFYKLFAEFEKPQVSFWSVFMFVWTNLGGGLQLMVCLFCTSLVLGGNFLFFVICSGSLLHQKGKFSRLHDSKQTFKNGRNQATETQRTGRQSPSSSI